MVDGKWASEAVILPGNIRARLATILARAATPSERAAGRWVVAEGDEAAIVAARAAAWRQAVNGEDVAGFAHLLAERGLSIEAFHCGLHDVRLRDEAVLPVWAQTVYALTAA